MNSSARARTWRDSAAEIAGWAQEQLFASPWQAAGNLLLLSAAVWVFVRELRGAPAVALVVSALWLIGLLWVAAGTLRHQIGPLAQRLGERLYNTPGSALLTLILTLWLMGLVRALLNWAIFDASFTADPDVARASSHSGATWGIIVNNLRLFLVGQYPRSDDWRIWASLAVLAALVVVALLVYGPTRERFRRVRSAVTLLWFASPLILWFLLRGAGWPMWVGLALVVALVPVTQRLYTWMAAGPQARLASLAVALVWVVALVAIWLLLRAAHPTGVETRYWGGLLLTLVITVFAILVAFPLGVLLALGRRSHLPGIPAWLTYLVVGVSVVWGLRAYTLPGWRSARNPLEYFLLLWPAWLAVAAIVFQRAYRGNVVGAGSTIFIEFVRGVPLITVLFMAQIMFPLFLPTEVEIENAYRAMWGFALFSAAYLAENVRGGLQSIPRGQYEAAEALGLNTVQQLRRVILPQALRVVIPPNTGLAIGIFKDTSLVAIVGLIDLLGMANAVIAQPDWLGLRRESYFFITVVYYLGCYGLAAAGRWLEKRSGLGVR